jgi:pyruvate kinase
LTIPIEEAMANVREAASRTRTNPGVYLYLRDVDLVIGKFAEAENPGETLTYAKDETIVIRPTKASSGQELGCDEESILSFIHLGDEFAFDYGKNVLKVTEINADHMVVR